MPPVLTGGNLLLFFPLWLKRRLWRFSALSGNFNQNEVNYAKRTQFFKKSNVYNSNYDNELQRKIDIGHLVKTNPILSASGGFKRGQTGFEIAAMFSLLVVIPLPATKGYRHIPRPCQVHRAAASGGPFQGPECTAHYSGTCCSLFGNRYASLTY
jgi:hypothetical protein